MPAERGTYTRTDVIAHPLHTVAVSFRRKDVETNLGPVCNALCQLDGFMLLMLRRQHSVLRRGAALDSEVAVQFSQQSLGRDGLGRIDLNFVVVLSVEKQRASKKND